MPTSGPGSKVPAPGRLKGAARAAARGFTLLELLVVLAVVAVSAGLAVLALRDSNATRLEREAVRLAALLEMARAESRVSGTPVRWLPGAATDAQPPVSASAADEPRASFRFLGLSGQTQLPQRWLDDRVSATVPPPGFLVLGPDAILPAQRLSLRLEDQQIEIGSDGLGPFSVGGGAPASPP